MKSSLQVLTMQQGFVPGKVEENECTPRNYGLVTAWELVSVHGLPVKLEENRVQL